MPLYRRSEELLKQPQLRQTADFSEAAAKRIEPSSQELAAWFLFHVADSFGHAHQWREADEFFTRSIQTVQIHKRRVRAQIETAWARTFEQRTRWPDAEDHYRHALLEDLKFRAKNLAAAADLQNLARFNFVRGDLVKATQYAERALEIRGQLAPESLEFARTLNYLGAFSQRRGDLTKAENYHRRALVIEERVAPRSLDVARSFNNLGAIAQQRGDLAKAEDYYLRDLNMADPLGNHLKTGHTLSLQRVFRTFGGCVIREACCAFKTV
jgi:tetratricopeptide (TPR) repeat protein